MQRSGQSKPFDMLQESVYYPLGKFKAHAFYAGLTSVEPLYHKDLTDAVLQFAPLSAI